MNMKFKKLALVLAVVLMAGTVAPAFASPFADVPADHWAYDSIVELAAAGLIEGYPDGTYGGSRMMTRYEAAMVFARALHRLETQIGNIDLLPELDRVKAELMAEIEAAMAAAPAAETTVVERVIVDKDMDEETLARILANEVAIEALADDNAYLEDRMLGLIDGLRNDLNQLEDQVAGVEQPSMDEIEALIAARIQEGLIEAAAGVKETTVVERVVATTPELTRDDVEFIAEALIRAQLEQYDLKIQENRDLIVGLVDWVDEIDADVAVLKDDVADLKTTVAVLDKVRFSGSLALEGEYESGGEYDFTQEGKLNLNLKPAEGTNVRAFFDWELDPFATAGDDDNFKIEHYGVEVTSDTPVSRLLVGRIAKTNLSPFSNYVLPNAHQGFGGVAKVNVMDGLTLDVLGAQTVEGNGEVLAAVALTYEFIPELGIKLTGRADKPEGAMFDDYAAGIGLFGKVAGIEYTGDFAMDFNADDENFIAAATAKTTFEPLTIDGKFVYQAENYGLNNQMLRAGNKFSVEGGVEADLELAGVDFDLAGRAYYEAGQEEGATQDSVLAFKADASATVDFFVPVTLSGQVVSNTTGDANAEAELHALAKLEIAQKADLGLRYGASAAYEKNVLDSGSSSAPNWKNIAHFRGDDEARFGANVGYGLNWGGAKVDLDYAATFVLPTQPEGQDNTLKHEVDVAYAFTKDVKLTLGATVDQTLADILVNEFGYNAGVTVSF